MTAPQLKILDRALIKWHAESWSLQSTHNTYCTPYLTIYDTLSMNLKHYIPEVWMMAMGFESDYLTNIAHQSCTEKPQIFSRHLSGG